MSTQFPTGEAPGDLPLQTQAENMVKAAQEKATQAKDYAEFLKNSGCRADVGNAQVYAAGAQHQVDFAKEILLNSKGTVNDTTLAQIKIACDKVGFLCELVTNQFEAIVTRQAMLTNSQETKWNHDIPAYSAKTSTVQTASSGSASANSTTKTTLTAAQIYAKAKRELDEIKPLLVKKLPTNYAQDIYDYLSEKSKDIPGGLWYRIHILKQYLDHAPAMKNPEDKESLLDFSENIVSEGFPRYNPPTSESKSEGPKPESKSSGPKPR